jgi:hypothetical protein
MKLSPALAKLDAQVISPLAVPIVLLALLAWFAS